MLPRFRLQPSGKTTGRSSIRRLTGSSSSIGPAPHLLEVFCLSLAVPAFCLRTGERSGLFAPPLSCSGLPFRPTGELWLSLALPCRLSLAGLPFQFPGSVPIARSHQFPGPGSTGCFPVAPESVRSLARPSAPRVVPLQFPLPLARPRPPSLPDLPPSRLRFPSGRSVHSACASLSLREIDCRSCLSLGLKTM